MPYATVAAPDGDIYVFGGQGITGPHAGAANLIQRVEPGQVTWSSVGNLPLPLEGCVGCHLRRGTGLRRRRQPGGISPPLGLGTPQPTGLGTSNAGREPLPRTRAVGLSGPINPPAGVVAGGHLQVPVSHAGVAADGSTAWLVGGESEGAPVPRFR